jgi:error-prone DNA polymerase
MSRAPDYAELHCLSNFSFLRGASSPEELIVTANTRGYTALAVTDECSFSGVVRALEAAEKLGFKLIVGAEFRLADDLRCVLLASNRSAYAQISALITRGRIDNEKGRYRLTRDDVAALPLHDCLALWLPPAMPSIEDAQWLAAQFPQRTWIAVELHRGPDDGTRLRSLQQLGEHCNLPCMAAGDVHMHVRQRRRLQDTVTAIRHGLTLAECGARLFTNGERHLRRREDLAELYPHALLEETVAIAERCTFNLRELKYDYPKETVAPGYTSSAWLRKLTYRGYRNRWPDGGTRAIAKQIEDELALIAELGYEAFFLTVYNVVRYARRKKILCQGRGSAANSAVCYALGITNVNPAEQRLLFGRFISRERKEPPDIDVDFEHQRREEVMQYIFRKYGRQRAALAATVIRYRPRSALRDVGRALGVAPDDIDRLAKSLAWWDQPKDVLLQRLQELGFDPRAPLVRRWMNLAGELLGAPRHLSQHVGGFVISDQPVSELVPIENASMPNRTVIQWDKDDLEFMGLLKVDCLALGMLSAIRRALALTAAQGGPVTMTDVPHGDTATYAMIQAADTVGVFQIESRAQMSMLPRLKPETFYDLVIQIAIVRPGPIQGGMVHPYLKRRKNPNAVEYPSEALQHVLGRTLGVPLFQEQVIEIAQVAAGFSAGEADQLRRSMAAWKSNGNLEPMRNRLLAGMLDRGYTQAFAEQIFEMIKGFGSYGFPESHSASFALLAYVSAYLKCHHPAAFFAALVNSQPMGFYAPAQLIREARRAGVSVQPVDVTLSDWDCTLERASHDDLDKRYAIRLGLRMVQGLDETGGHRIVAMRKQQAFSSLEDFVKRTALDPRMRQAVVQADALQSISGHRHASGWHMHGIETLPGFLADHSATEPQQTTRHPKEGENILADYRSTGLTLRRHPLALLRPRLNRLNIRTAVELLAMSHGKQVRIAGIVLHRQRPPTAKGTMFMTLEDETGTHNLIVRKDLVETQRATLLGAQLLLVSAKLQKIEGVTQLVASHAKDATPWMGELAVASRDFR